MLKRHIFVMYPFGWSIWCLAVLMPIACLAMDGPDPGNEAIVSAYPTSIGAILAQEGSAVFSTNTWQLFLDLPLGQMRTDLDQLTGLINSWNGTMSNWLKNRQALFSLLADTKQTFEDLAGTGIENESVKVMKDANEPKIRSKRGWFNLGGDILWQIFGTATDKDLKQLSKRINEMADHDNAIVHALNSQMSLVKQMGEFLNTEDQRITDTVTAVEDLHQAVNSLHNRTQENSATIKHNARLALYSQLISGLNYFRTRLNELHMAVHRLKSGYLDSSYFHPQQLYQVLGQIQQKLPNNLRFVQDISPHSINAYYQWRICLFIPTENHVRVLVKIPLMTNDESFLLYNVIPFPIVVNGTRMQLKTEAKQVAITPDQSKFAVIRPEALRHCIPGEIRVCPLVQAFQLHPHHCLYKMITQRLTVENDNCNYEVVDHTDPVIAPITSSRWAISLASIERIDVSCLKEVSGFHEQTMVIVQSIEGQGNMLMQLPLHCSARIGAWEIPLRLDSSGQTSLELKPDGAIFPLLPDFVTENLISKIQEHQSIDNWLQQASENLKNASKGRKLSFNEIIQAVNEIDWKPQFTGQDFIQLWQWPLFMLVMAMWLAFGLIVCKYAHYRWRHRSVVMRPMYVSEEAQEYKPAMPIQLALLPDE